MKKVVGFQIHHFKIALLLTGLIGGLLLHWPARAAGRQTPATVQAGKLFAEKILPALKAKCQSCHNSTALVSGLDLSSRAAMLKGGQRGAALSPGDAAKSLLFIAIEGDGELKMPPGNNKRLPTDLIAAFRQWIDVGAPWTEAAVASKWEYKDEDLWALKPLRRYEAPSAGNSQAQTPIDAFLLNRLGEKNLTPAPQADRLTLIRRATFDLHGLPPTPEEVEAFLKDPSLTPQAFAKVVERLLGSPRYGQRCGRHWLDVARYADTGGGSNDYERPHAWRYRDYVIRAFNHDKPYDQFIIEQIAGDELDAGNAENLIATGFLRMGSWEQTAMSVEAVTRQEWLDDVTHNTATAFLGLTMGCAKCHDHKFDPIPQKDYYSLQAVFAGTYFADRPAPFLPDENLKAKERELSRLQSKLDRALAKLRKFSEALGVKFREPRLQTPGQPARPTAQAAQSVAAQDKTEPQTELKKRGDDPRRAELFELERAYFKRVEFGKLAVRRYEPLAYSVASGGLPTPNPAEETFLLIGGNLNARGDKVAPAVPGAPCEFSGRPAPIIPASAAGRRLALAKWIASKDHPLTARVMVNRIWQWHFGKGLVETSNNFGKLGKRPSHPELLDWLAMYFSSHGWSIKTMRRLIMNSAAYQRASAFQSRAQFEAVRQADPENRSLAYFPPRRLEAEELRDAMLAVSGELNLEIGGPGAFPELNADLVAQPRLIMGTVGLAWESSLLRADRNRRTIYTFQQRSLVNPMVEVFNGASMNESCEARRASTVAPQVFNLFNSQFSHDTALAFARRLESMTRDPARQIDLAFRLAFQRPPTAAERRQAMAHVKAMIAHHGRVKPPARPELKPPELLVNSEFTGQTIRFVEDTDFTGYERNPHPSEVRASTRALAELCLALLNANEFMYVY